MQATDTLADQLRSVSMQVVWAIVFCVIIVALGVFSPLETIEYLLINRGIGDEGIGVIAFVAGYTLPLACGFGALAFLYLTGINRDWGLSGQVGCATLVLFVAGELARALSLGLAPDYHGAIDTHISGYFKPLAIVLAAYLNAYGLPLVACALAIGTAGAMHVERWVNPLR